jgi:hypothetical protein
VCCIAAPAADAAFPGQNGRIAFTRQHSSGGFPTDVYTVMPNGLGTMRLTTSGTGRAPAWSPDGTRIAFVEQDTVVTANEDGTDRAVVLTWTHGEDIGGLTWSPAGDKLALSLRSGEPSCCFREIYTVGSDGSNLTRLTFEPRDAQRPSWSPDGQRIAFDSERSGSPELFTIRPDGTDLTSLTPGLPGGERDPDWSPDGASISFVQISVAPTGVYRMPSSGGVAQHLGVPNAQAQAWSPDGQRIAFTTFEPTPRPVRTMNAADGQGVQQVTAPQPSFDDQEVAWQPVPQPPPPQPPLFGPGYPRPKGATPVSVSLVPAYDQCVLSNRTHGPPLAFPSCNAPSRSSPTLTVGTPDANGNPVQFAASVSLQVVVGQPGRPEDAAVLLDVAMNDVRWNSGCAGSPPPCELEPYIGDLELVTSLRITDRLTNGGPDNTEAATTSDAPLSIPLACDGSRCDVETDLNAVLPGVVRERRRAIWELGQVRVLDAGPDGTLSTTGDQSTFLRQGIFVP